MLDFCKFPVRNSEKTLTLLENLHKSRLQRRPSGKMPVKAGLYISRRKCYNNKLCNCVSREEADPWRFCRGCWTT